MSAPITRYMQSPNGGRNLGVQVLGVDVLVKCDHESEQPIADRVAESIASIDALLTRAEGLESERQRLVDRIRGLEMDIAVLTGDARSRWFVELADADGLIVERIDVEIVTGGPAQRLVFDAIAEHHRHHGRPRGWHFGVIARRGSVLVGVASCGRPVSRHLQARGVVEVTRVCTWGDSRLRRDVASAIYRAAIAEYRRRRTVRMAGRELQVTEVVTYTLASETGASCRGAGFVEQGAAGGGSWDRAARRRTDAAPTQRKTRWAVAVAPQAQAAGGAR